MPASGRRKPLHRELIVATATDLAERSGLDAVTLRAVAGLLRVSPMALYRHVATYDELIDLVIEELIAREPSARVRWPEGWRERIRIVAGQIRSSVMRHPTILAVAQRRSVVNSMALDHMERLFEALTADGFTLEEAVDIYSNLVAFVLGFVALEHGREQARLSAHRTVHEQRGATLDGFVQAAAKHPLVRAAAVHLAKLTDPEHFTNGVERFIAGIHRGGRSQPGPPGAE